MIYLALKMQGRNSLQRIQSVPHIFMTMQLCNFRLMASIWYTYFMGAIYIVSLSHLHKVEKPFIRKADKSSMMLFSITTG